MYFINQLSWDDGSSVRRYRLVKFVNKSLLESSKKMADCSIALQWHGFLGEMFSTVVMLEEKASIIF